MSTESARLNRPKIELACTCGKKYRVPASKAGKKIKCKNCNLKIRVPRDASVSGRSRAAILAELGIDPMSAAEAYEAERAKRVRPDDETTTAGQYRCAGCDFEIAEADLKAAYCAEGLLCALCRARKAEGTLPSKRAAIEIACELEIEPALASARHAAVYFGLFFAGFAGPLVTFAPISRGASLAIALPIALIGAAVVYRHRRLTAPAATPIARRKRKQVDEGGVEMI